MIKGYLGDRFVGLSTDTKPTNVEDGAFFTTLDTQVAYILSGSWIPLTGSSSSSSSSSSSNSSLITVNQTSHGFSQGNVVRVISDNTFGIASADSDSVADVAGIIKTVNSANSFDLLLNGVITGSWINGAGGEVRYLNTGSVGIPMPTAPSSTGNVHKPLIITLASGSGIFYNWRGYIISSGSSSSSSSNSSISSDYAARDSKIFTQIAHNFIPGNIVRVTGNNTFGYSNATGDLTADVAGVITQVIDSNTIELTTHGYVTGTWISGNGGDIYYLNIVNGGLTTTSFTQTGYIHKPLLMTYSSGSGFFNNYRGYLIGSSGSSSSSSSNSSVASDYASRDSKLFYQVSHPFSIGNVLRVSGENLFGFASASTESLADVVGVVSQVIDANTFELTTHGYVTGAWVNGTGTTILYLGTSNGNLTSTAPTTLSQVHKPLISIYGSGSGFFNNWRGYVNTSGSSSSSNGSYVSLFVDQTAHGFSNGNVVRATGNGGFGYSNASSDSTADVAGIVLSVPNANRFELLLEGYANGSWIAGNGGDVYYLATTDGGLTTTAPTTVGQVHKPLVTVVGPSYGLFHNYRGYIIGTGGSSSSSASSATTNSVLIRQVAHPFSLGYPIRVTGDNLYGIATASGEATADVVGIVTRIVDANNFELTTHGVITGGWITANNTYYLSTTTGTLSTTAASQSGQVHKPLLVAFGSNSGLFNNWRGFIVGSGGASSAGGSSSIDTGQLAAISAGLRSNVNVNGGGQIVFSTGSEVKWSQRLIVISDSKGSNFSTDGYFDINTPAAGTTITGANVANRLANANGIPIYDWEALYYALPTGKDHTFRSDYFRVAAFTGSDVDIPYNWTLLAVKNADSPKYLSLSNGVKINLGETGSAWEAPNSTINNFTIPGNLMVGTGALYSTGTNSVGFGTLNPTAQVDIAGQLRYRFGTPTSGMVMTAFDSSGNVVWQNVTGAGLSGFSGFSGYSGFSGISGWSGFSGLSGWSGYSGYSGISGWSGATGPAGSGGLDTGILAALIPSLRSNININGGGLVSFSSNAELKWSQRFIVIGDSEGLPFSTDGYFDINFPSVSTNISGANAADRAVNANGIPLDDWDALYYVLPTGKDHTFKSENFRVVNFAGGNYNVPYWWTLLAINNADTPGKYAHLTNGVRVNKGETGSAWEAPNSTLYNFTVPGTLYAQTGLISSGFAGFGYNNPTAQLDVSGTMRYRRSGVVSGMVATAFDSQGTVVWQSGGLGISGFSGFSGISGWSGFSGISGWSGFSGISGWSGVSGWSGFSGFSGISGYSGVGTSYWDRRNDTTSQTIFPTTITDKVGVGTAFVGDVAAAIFQIKGKDSVPESGAHFCATTDADIYPLYQMLAYSHDSIFLTFDSYFSKGPTSPTWKSSDAGSNFYIGKFLDTLSIAYANGYAQGSDITWAYALSIDKNGKVGIGTTNPSSTLELNGTLQLQNLSATTPVAGSVLQSTNTLGDCAWSANPGITGAYNLYHTLGSAVSAGTAITLPNSETYTFGKLDVYVEGIKQVLDSNSSADDNDYWQTSSTSVDFTYALPVNTQLTFTIYKP